MAASKQLKRLKLWHYRLIDWMLANPQASQVEVAQEFNKSPVWISLLVNSPIFQAEFERRSDMMTQSVAERVSGRATSVANMSLEQLRDRLERERHTMPIAEVRETAALALRLLGYPTT